MRAARPTTRPALARHRLGAGSLNPPRPRLRFLGGLNPTYPFIPGDGSKVFPRVKRPGVRTERVAQVCWYLVHHAGRDLSSSHCPFTTRFREGLETPPSMAGRRVARTSIGSTGGYQTRQVSAPRPLPAEAATPSMQRGHRECGVRLESAPRRDRTLVTRPNMSFVTPAAPSALCIPSPSAA